MMLSKRRARAWALALLVVAAAILLTAVGWYGKTWVRHWAVAPTPAQDVAAELTRYSQQEKAFGRRGQLFEQVALKLSWHGLKWSEAEVVQGLGTPDGMYRAPSGDLLLYKYTMESPGDRIVIVQLVSGAVSAVGFNTVSEIGQGWAPYQPPGLPPPASPAEATATSQPDTTDAASSGERRN